MPLPASLSLLLLAPRMMLGVVLGGLAGMVTCMGGVSMRSRCVVSCTLMAAGIVMPGCLPVVCGRPLVVLGGRGAVLGTFVLRGHVVPPRPPQLN